ncbi:glycosyl transferase [Marinobacterium zhoushanense]|uniref:Glycosyl transferase n=1 Tax=Marinobacterium zhoushanense TaxID=1679163 RepID=A0ABQ1KSB3_9GAMM|nr:glycosyltransferase family 4 protein [Marinobacterium zhoushanense]GGC06855.1 glycosyl transferase [Marinobacterium zhoushanense]
MKVLHVSTYDIYGGAARAAYRLHEALLNENVDSKILVQSKSGDDDLVLVSKSKIVRLFNKLRPAFDSLPLVRYSDRSRVLFSPAWLPFSDVVKKINEVKPDIVHLHWLCDGMVSVDELAKISVPVVWTLHDMWAFTGGCHYSEGCEKFKHGCNGCPLLKKGDKKDLSSWVMRRKEKSFSRIPSLTLVGVSQWLEREAKESFLFANRQAISIPNPINTNIYRPVDRNVARRLLDLSPDKKIVLFGAMGAESDARKGYSKLVEALAALNVNDVELVIFGSSPPRIQDGDLKGVHYLGRLYDDLSLCIAYSAADAMVVPSLQEAFGQTASEAMSCGTPVVAFDTTGLKDIVDHKINGYLAKPFEAIDLAKGIEWVLHNSNHTQLSKNAREKVVNQFDYAVVGEKYCALYQSLLNS